MVTDTVPVGVPPSAMGPLPDALTRYTSDIFPSTPPLSDALSGRFERSMLNETVVVCPGALVIAPDCGTIQGASATAMPTSVPVPLFLYWSQPATFWPARAD